MRNRVLALFIVMLFVMPITSSFVTIPGGSNFQNVTQPEKELSYDEKQTKHTACGGSVDSDLYIDGDYWDTWEDDASYLSAYPINYTGIHLVFNITETIAIGELNFFLRWQVTIDNPGDQPMPVYWRIYNFDTSSYETVYSALPGSTISWEDREESITYDEKYVNSTNHIIFYASGSNIYVDEIEVDYAYLTVTKEHVGEFRETLPNDVLYYPDPLEHSACGGSEDSNPFITGDYWDTWEDDASHLTADSSFSVGISLVFNITEYSNFIVDNATLSIFLRWEAVLAGGGDVPEMYWKIYNFDTSTWHTIYSMILGTTLNFEDREESITFDDKYVNSTNHVRFGVTSNSTYADSITVDYAYITATNDFTESFADVSDWVGLQDSPSTDGDVGIFTTSSDYSYDTYYSNIPSAVDWFEYYLEIRIKANVTGGKFYLYTYTADNSTGSQVYSMTTISTVPIIWTTYRYLLNENEGLTTKSFQLRFRSYSNVEYTADYMRVSKSIETGWQHDGSILDDITVSGSASVSTDGDLLNVSATSAVQYADIFIDSTSTEAKIPTSEYPFLSWKVDSLHDNDGDDLVYLVRVYEDVGTYQSLYAYSFENGTFRANIAVYLDYLWKIRIYIRDASEWVQFDYIKSFSIANYTVTESSTTADDYLYVEDGILNSNMDNGSFILDYDPSFFLNGSYTWTKSTLSGESFLSFLHGGWTDYSNETTGNLYAGTTTGLRIKFNETANIQTIEYSVRQAQWVLIGTAIIYFDMPNWWVIGVAGAVFYIPIGELTLQFLLMIMGLVMIPFSTLFLVKGGRDEMSKDKLYFFLLMFLIGWALFLGGIL